MFKPTLRNLFIVFVVWGAVGFVLGMEILMGPVRWAVEFCRNNPAYSAWEQPLVRSLMVILVAVSLPAAIFLTGHLINTARWHVRLFIPLLLGVSLFMTLHVAMNPDKFNLPRDMRDAAEERFVVGPYPDKAQLMLLKNQGFSGVISLLHPAVVPFEPVLIAEEKANAKDAGIEMIHIPMLPWISENREAIARITELASTGTNRYYLHCYLGKDRVNVALKTVERAGASVNKGLAGKARQLAERTALERGRIYILEEGMYLSGFPTDEEFLAYIIAAGISNVVSIMEVDSESGAKWLAKEKNVLESHGVGFRHLPLKNSPYDPEAAVKIMDVVSSLGKPVYVHDFRSPSAGIQALLQAHAKKMPCIPPMLISSNMLVGKVQAVAPNIITGPRPTELKQFSELEKLGVRAYVYFGSTNSAEAVRDRAFTSAGDYDWRCISGHDDGTFTVFAEGGPWYIYGDLPSGVLETLAAMFGPACPEPMAYVVKQHDAALAAQEQSCGMTAEYRYADLLAAIRQGQEGSLKARCLDFYMSSVPNLKMVLLLGPFCLFYAYVCAGYAGWLKTARGVRTPYTRKIFHFLIFTMAGVMQIMAGTPAVILFGSIVACCVLYAVLRGDGFAFYEAMARPTDAPKRTMFILIPLVTTALGGVIANIFFQPVAAIGYLVGGWGDAIGEPVGSKWGKHKYKVPSMFGVPATRSVEGSLSVALAGFFAALIGLCLLGVPLAIAAQLALLCSAGCALVEAISTHGLDNLTVQVVAAAIVFYMLA